MRYLQISAFGMAMLLSTVPLALAGDHCAHCGCNDGCQQVCRLVREDKKVNIVCWGCKCEDFCAPGRSCRDGRHCEDVCEDCDGEVCAAPKTFVWYDWTPACGKHIFTKKKLMKKTIVKTIPSYKWVVENICGQCEGQCDCAVIEPGATIPSPPQTAARLVPGVMAK